MEHTDILELMSTLKPYDMRAVYDEMMTNGIKRRHEPPRIVGDLLSAEIAEKQARSIKYQDGDQFGCQRRLARTLVSVRSCTRTSRDRTGGRGDCDDTDARARLTAPAPTRMWSSQKGRRPAASSPAHRYAVFELDKQALEVNLVLPTRQARRSWPCD